MSAEDGERFVRAIERDWGRRSFMNIWAPSRDNDEAYKLWLTRALRMSASPGAAVALVKSWFEIDVRQLLPAIRLPTLVLHRTGDRAVSVGGGRYFG